MWIVFFSIMRLCVPYGMLSSVALGFLGLCLDELLTCLHVGGLLVALGMLLCGRWRLLVFFFFYFF
jgi:cytosine/uracil/thiamine/allantoin permease